MALKQDQKCISFSPFTTVQVSLKVPWRSNRNGVTSPPCNPVIFLWSFSSVRAAENSTPGRATSVTKGGNIYRYKAVFTRVRVWAIAIDKSPLLHTGSLVGSLFRAQKDGRVFSIHSEKLLRTHASFGSCRIWWCNEQSRLDFWGK